MNKHNPIRFTAAKDGKTVELDIEGSIGGDYDWWTGKVSGATKEAIKAELKAIGTLKTDTIIVNINSYGGDVNHGLSIHDLLAQNPAKKIVRINGMTASAATVIAMAGDEIEMSDNALFLVHRASTMGWGNQNEMKTLLKDLDTIDNLMANIYAKRTGKTKEEILEQMDKSVTGEWMTAEEAKAFGFIDNVFEPTKMAASFNSEFLAKSGLPAIPTNKLKTNEMKKETFIASLLAGFNNLFNAEKNKDFKKEEIEALISSTINSVADEEVKKYDAAIAEINAAADNEKEELKNGFEADKKAFEAKIASLNNDLTAANAEIAKLKGTPVETPGAVDASIEGNKKKLTPNEAAAEANAKALLED